MVSSRTGNHTEEDVPSAGSDERVSRTVIKPRAGFRAELPGLDIATLIQMTCARRERLVVRVASYDDEGFIYSSDGRIVHATLGALVGEEAVLGMMAWTGGEFAIVDRPFPPQPSIVRSTETLLLCAAQRSDEAAARVSSAPPAPTSSARAPKTDAEASPLAARAEEQSASASAPPSATTASSARSSIPPPAARASTAVASARISSPSPAGRISIPPPAARISIPPPAGRTSTPPPSMPPSAYANATPGSAGTRDSVVPTARDIRAQSVAAVPRGSIQSALRESYDEEDEVPTLLPPAPRAERAPSIVPPGETASSDTPRRSKLPPPLPPAARKPGSVRAPEDTRVAARSEPINDSTLIASVRVDARGQVVGTFAGEGMGDLLPQLVAYVARLIALLRVDFSLDPFEALHAELSGMRIMLFEDAGEMVGLMMRPGSAVQELRQRLGV